MIDRLRALFGNPPESAEAPTGDKEGPAGQQDMDEAPRSPPRKDPEMTVKSLPYTTTFERYGIVMHNIMLNFLS